MTTYKKVLVMRLSALGDVAMTIPQIYSVCRAYPETTFVILTQRVTSSLFMYAPANLQIYIADVKARHKGLAGLWLLYKELSALGIDAVADLHNVLRTKTLRLLFRLAGKPTFVIDKGRASKRQLTSRHHKELHPLKPMAERYADVFRAMSMPYTPQFTTLYPEGKGDAGLLSALTPPKKEGEYWIGIAPFAKHEGKIYPPDEMERVVALLSRHERLHIFLFGAGSEAELLARWQERYPRVTSLASQRLGFKVELSLMSYLDVMLSMDSANMHLAALAGVPVVSVWGATHPYAGFLGYTASPADVIQSDLPCRPCSVFGNKPCYRGDYACLRAIRPERVVEKVLGHTSL